MVTVGPELGIPGVEGAVEIGRGGFGVVYRATQPRFDRTVAVKVLSALPDERARERFERECRAVGALSAHPNIVTVFDSGFTDSGHPYLVMEHMPAGTLADRQRRDGRLPWQEAAAIGVKLAGAVEMAHRNGILHRDIKPENILISQYGECCLSDFGLARLQGGTESRTGSVTTSLAHAAPEVIAGHSASPAADVYSLASCVFGLLAGAAAFVRDSDETLVPLLARIATDPVPDLRGVGVPDPVCRTVEAAMAKSPAERPASAEAFGLALRGAAREAGADATQMTVLDLTDNGPDGHGLVAPVRTAGAPYVDTQPVALAGASPTADVPLPFTEHDAVKTSGRYPWWRSRLAISVASGLVVVAAIGALVATRGGDDKGTIRAEGVSSPGIYVFKRATLAASGSAVDRTWRLTGRNGNSFDAKITVTNPKDTPTIDSFVEVIPKEIASDVSQITFDPKPDEVKNADPIVRYAFGLPAKGQKTFTYHVDVPADGTGTTRLEKLADALRRAAAEYERTTTATSSPTTPPPPQPTTPPPTSPSPGRRPTTQPRPPATAAPNRPPSPAGKYLGWKGTFHTSAICGAEYCAGYQFTFIGDEFVDAEGDAWQLQSATLQSGQGSLSVTFGGPGCGRGCATFTPSDPYSLPQTFAISWIVNDPRGSNTPSAALLLQYEVTR